MPINPVLIKKLLKVLAKKGLKKLTNSSIKKLEKQLPKEAEKVLSRPPVKPELPMSTRDYLKDQIRQHQFEMDIFRHDVPKNKQNINNLLDQASYLFDLEKKVPSKKIVDKLKTKIKE